MKYYSPLNLISNEDLVRQWYIKKKDYKFMKTKLLKSYVVLKFNMFKKRIENVRYH